MDIIGAGASTVSTVRRLSTLQSVHGGSTVYNTWMVPKVIATPAAVSTLSLILSLTRPLQPYR